METKLLEGYTLDIIQIEYFKDYYYNNLERFSEFSKNAFLKTLDIPPKFFTEQPEETQEELLENREVFVRESKKFFDKVIVVLKDKDNYILNACRMDTKVAEASYKALSAINAFSNRYTERLFHKDGYITILIPSEDLEYKDRAIIVDFPIMLNKNAVIHKAFYEVKGDFTHYQYKSNLEVSLVGDNKNYNDLYEAIKDCTEFLTEPYEMQVSEPILREPEVISLAVIELKFLPKTYREKFEKYLSEKSEGIIMNSYKLEQVVMDFDADVKGYKNVLNLRNVDGGAIKTYLDTLKDIDRNVQELESVLLNE